MEQNSYSLFELLRRVKQSLSYSFPETYWVKAETSDLRVNNFSGHCYLELIEKEASQGQTIAKIRANIWAGIFKQIAYTFKNETGEELRSGIQILARVSVTFHPLYGISFNVLDIDPSFTIGAMAKQRKAVIDRLVKDGVFDLNKELKLSETPQRIAIISSSTAAGYEDFLNQLNRNNYGVKFYTKLFPAYMQGDKTETSILKALEKIFDYADAFDAVVIIRGGGASSELNAFDSYNLAAACAQFPIPVLTGIGHERDESIVDMVAHTRLKTPTAVAEFLINLMAEALALVENLYLQISKETQALISNQQKQLTIIVSRLPISSSKIINIQKENIHSLQVRILSGKQSILTQEYRHLESIEQVLKLISPERMLERGYSLTSVNGQIIKSINDVHVGDVIETRLKDGIIYSVSEHTQLKE